MTFIGDTRIKTPSCGVLNTSKVCGVMNNIRQDGVYEVPTFYKNFNSRTPNAEVSGGSNVLTLTASRGASNPATFTNTSGKFEVTTTSDTPRYTNKYYNSSGVQNYSATGLIVEGAATNYIFNSYFSLDTNTDGLADGWGSSFGTTTLDSVSAISDITDHKAQRVQHTYTGGEGAYQYFLSYTTAVGSFVQNDDICYSFLIKGSVDVDSLYYNILVYEADAAGGYLASVGSYSLLSFSENNFIRVVIKGTMTNASASRLGIVFGDYGLNIPSNGNAIDLSITNVQVEKKKHPTSFIPTTTTSLTRNAETPTYVISNNRTDTVETIILKAAWYYDQDENSIDRKFISSDTKRRLISNDEGTNSLIFNPNIDDSSSCTTGNGGTQLSKETQYTVGGSCQQSSPYATLYLDGVAYGTADTTNTYITPAWGTDFYLGCENDSTGQLDGIIFQVGIFGKVLSSAQHLQSNSVNLNRIDP